MKVETILSDATALEVVLRCAMCHERATFTPAEWLEGNLDRCPHCGDVWAERERIDIARRALRSLHDLVRTFGASDAPVPFTAQFGATRIIRNAAR